jgi:quercetin dioxygenase-like cupin family protein
MKRFVLACAFVALGSATAMAADAPKITVEKVINTDKTVIGQPIVMPKDPTLVATIATFPPGSRLPAHKHLYPHYGYMLEGVLTVTNVQTGKSFTVKKGDFLVEMNDTWHYGQNNGTEPVKMLIIDHQPKGVTSNIVLRDAK